MLCKRSVEGKEIFWTRHARGKMRFYQLSEKRLKKVLRKPDREEMGVAHGTSALMQKAGSEKNPYEIWLMYQKTKAKNREEKIKIISAWRYPGISPVGKPPIPEDVLEALKD